MEILEKGTLWKLKVKCTGRGNGEVGCNSKLLVEEKDIFVSTPGIDYYGGQYNKKISFGFRCPVCNFVTDIPENMIPTIIRKNILIDYRMELDRANSHEWR